MEMLAAILHGPNDLRFEATALPQLADEEVLIDVRATGVCGSDVPRVFGEAAHYYPLILGHEFSGVVAEVGKKVDDAWLGQAVAVAPLVPCHECANCQQGRYALCPNYRFIGSSRNGALAQFVAVPSRNLVPLGEGLNFIQGALVEPSSVALHGLLVGGFEPGADVAVLGAGMIGNLTSQWAKLFGAQSVTVVDISTQRLEVALETGADYAINSSLEDVLEQVQNITGGRGFSHLFETAGQNVTQQLALELAGVRSKITLIGNSAQDLSFPAAKFELLNRKEITLTASWMSYSAPFPGREWTQSVRYMQEGRLLTPNSLLHDRFPLAETRAGMSVLREPGEARGKIMFVQDPTEKSDREEKGETNAL